MAVRETPAYLIGAFALLLHAVTVTAAQDDKVSNVSATVHNLSSTGTGDVTTTEAETEICVFCHTPHGATTFPGAPLWNRSVNDTYTPYTSSSLDAESIMGGSLDSPAGSSKLCLSCHDGTLALGAVNVFAGETDYTFSMTSPTMPDDSGSLTGFTRNLGTDLTNDHPISLTYDGTLASTDGELFDPASVAHIGLRSPGVKPLVPLEPTGSGGAAQIQCATCHDPHIHDPTATTSIKFLRLNRFQQGPAVDGSFSELNDIVCLACHDKEGWATSAHADTNAADETYISAAPNLREIPPGFPVWQVSCLNCHDTHTVYGSRRLLREGTDSLSDPKSGGNPAIEETCYQCHSSTPVITNASNDVPDIETDFSLNRHMPITTSDQPASTEVHDITDADFSETRLLLGRTDLTNRHVECTDCHNPHRLMKDRLFSGDSGDTTEGTHDHSDGHTNIASGVLRGTWGVEPIYGGEQFFDLPIDYQVKKGDGGIGAPAGASGQDLTYVTREYQVCLKCHSDYGYNDDGTYPSGGRPIPGDSGGTTVGVNNLTEYTNQAMEFQAPLGDKGEPGGNHRSWHPVIDNTGRDFTTRFAGGDGGSDPFLAPWDGNNLGSQTMYCSDCHGSSTGSQTVVPSGNNPWGPHGSNNNFILKGNWDANTGAGTSNDICFKCHNYDAYGNPNTSRDYDSGFMTDRGNGHYIHNTDDRLSTGIKCNWCHVAVPHGWQNKALLVDISQEPACPNEGPCNVGPYYNNAFLGSNGQSVNWAASGDWRYEDCGGDALMRDGVCDQFR